MGVFSLRPKISLNLYMSNAQIGSNVSRIYWSLQLAETESQPSYSGFPDNNQLTLSFYWSNGNHVVYGPGDGRLKFTFNFQPAGLQTFILSEGSFDVAHPSNGDPFIVYGNSNAASNLLGTALGSAETTTSDYNYTPVWQSINIPSPVVRGVGYSGQVVASNTSSYGVISGSFPPGLSFNSNGTITGTPTAVGSYNFNYRAYGSLEGSVDANATIVVNPPLPVFSDQTITTTWIKTINFSSAPDRTVTASDAVSYSLVASGSGLNPTGWLTINSSGQLSGLPTTLGTYTFRVRATNSISQTTDTNLITLTVNPPGNRATGPGATSDLTVGKRYDGTNWIDISTFKRFDGTNWVDVVN
jgi:hypothetical protein